MAAQTSASRWLPSTYILPSSVRSWQVFGAYIEKWEEQSLSRLIRDVWE